MQITAYLAGDIHSDWRGEIAAGLREAGLAIRTVGAVTDHDASDACGTDILGEQGSRFHDDQAGAGVNAVRTRALLARSDVVVVRFAAKFGEYNGALDAGRALALGKPLITLHPQELDHALKEVDRVALAVARSPDQVVAILRYAFADVATPAPMEVS
ncbi:MAG: YtoQ family protein [Solirubrobacterales bacterium]|nr:YtoQ family protein [Solirubrobacterales bacterium]